jgi:hypothetical protein
MTSPSEIAPQIFGDFHSPILAQKECLSINFSAGLVPKQQFWPNSSLSAKFISDYLGMFFPVQDDNPDCQRKQAGIKDAVRYIANELLENVAKFSNPKFEQSPQLRLYINNHKIFIVVTNATHVSNLESFKELIRELTTLAPVELYVNRLEKNLEESNSHCSGLGFITILSNYPAKIGWQLAPLASEPDGVMVTTMVQLLYDWIDCSKGNLVEPRDGN